MFTYNVNIRIMKLNYLIYTFVFFQIHAVFGQQDPQFTQFFDNKLFVNPAYAGSKDLLNFTAMHREQWMGFEGKPVSTTMSLHSPLRYETVGLGLTMVRDQSGPISQTMAYGDFSYTLKFKNELRKISFGLKAGINNISAATSELKTTEENDPKLAQNIRSDINPNFGLGIYYHSPRFFVGISSPRIIEQSYGLSATTLEKRHYFGIIGSLMTLNKNLKMRPSLQAKMTTGAPISLDISNALIYKDKVWFGAMYRWEAAVGFFIQSQLNDQFKVGLATDIGTQALRKYNTGTLEVLLSYDFRFKKTGIRSPRYF
jgi:type IX secretion system PorP/SprF family membrane protein